MKHLLSTRTVLFLSIMFSLCAATTDSPTATPTLTPTANPTATPTLTPTANPSHSPTGHPSGQPSGQPTGTSYASPVILNDSCVTITLSSAPFLCVDHVSANTSNRTFLISANDF